MQFNHNTEDFSTVKKEDKVGLLCSSIKYLISNTHPTHIHTHMHTSPCTYHTSQAELFQAQDRPLAPHRYTVNVNGMELNQAKYTERGQETEKDYEPGGACSRKRAREGKSLAGTLGLLRP